MRRDAQGFYYFVDRIGDTFRWKGENVATTEVANALAGCPGVVEASVYGVAVPGSEGKAGMAAIKIEGVPDLERIAAVLEQTLPAYARPLFLRLVESFEATETFKQKKGGLAAEGFDPSRIADPLFVAVAGRYQPLTSEIHADIQSGGCASKASPQGLSPSSR